MEALLITLGAIAVAVCLLITILKSNRCDSLQTEVDILRKRNSTLEEKFEQMDSQENFASGEISHTIGSDVLERFAQENGCKLEHHESNEMQWKIYSMRYQGGYFVIYTRFCEVVFNYNNFAELPYTPDVYMKVLALCYRFNQRYRYFKLDYEYDQERNLFSFSLSIELINPPCDWLESILTANFSAADVVRKELEGFQNDDGSEDPDSDSDSNQQNGSPFDTSTLLAIHNSVGGEA